MVIRIILFVLGIVFYLKGCGDTSLGGWLVCAVIVFGLFCRNRQYAFFFLGGVVWVMAWGVWQGGRELSTQLEGRDINIVGVVCGLPKSDQRRTKFDLSVIHSESGPLPEKIRLNWYGPPKVIRAGQQWQLTVRLKKPHGYANPGGFDYEQWLFTQGIGATGYVRSKPTALFIGTSDYNFSSADLRQYFHTLLTKQIGHSPYYGI